MEMEAQTVSVDLSAPPAPASNPVAPVAAFTGAPGNFQADLAALAAAENPPVAPAVVVPEATLEPEQPATTDTATAPVTVPDKFKDAEGNLDAAKLDKSQAAAEEKIAAINKYLETQKVMRQKEREAQAFKSQPPAVPANIAPVVPQATQAPLTAFEIQVANDLINEAAAYGYQMPQGQAIAQARVQVKMAEARHAAEASLTETLRAKLEDQERRTQLEEIGKYDQEVLTPAGLDRLAQIRAERPWLDGATNPTQAAYEVYLAEQVKKSRQTGQVLPTPKGLTAKAPPTPVSPAPRAVVQPKGPDMSSKESIDAHLATKDLKGQSEFFAKHGLKL